MSVWSNGRALTATTYDLVRSTPQLRSWAVRAIVLGGLTGALGVVPGALLIATQASAAIIVGVVLMLAGGFAATVVANLQMAALVVAADATLHGRDADEAACRAEAGRHLGAITGWAGLSVLMGVITSVIRGDSGGGLATTIIRTIAAGMVAAAWSLVTFLVLPVIVIEHVGAVAAVKRSGHLMRARWGEAIGGSIRIGARFGLLYVLPGIVCIALGIAAAVALGTAGGLALGALGVLAGLSLVLVGTVLAQTCRTVFGVALYRWVADNEIVGPFTEAQLASAGRARGASA
jgi:hypothetical protein